MNCDLALGPDHQGWDIEPYRGRESPGQDPHDSPVLDLPTLLRIFHRWRWLILAAAGAGAAIGIAAALLTTPMYRASVLLQVNPPTVEILDQKSGGTTDTSTPWDFVATQVGLLKSTALAKRVAESLNLPSDPAIVDQSIDPTQRVKAATGVVEGGLDVTVPDEGQLITFSFTSDSPQLAAKIANGIADEFINSDLQRQYQSSAYARNFLQRQIAKTRGELEASERALVHYAQSEGIINTSSDQSGSPVEGGGTSPQSESLVALNQALADATAKRVAAEAAYRAALGGGVTSAETASSQALRQSRAALEAQYQQKRTMMKPDHPEMVSLRSQIEELDRQIAQENSKVASARINSLRDDYKAAVAAEQALKTRVANAKSQVLDLRGRSVRYAILQRDVDTNRALYDALLQRYKEIGVAGGIGKTPVSIVDRATVPSGPFKPNFSIDLIAGLVLGFIAGVCAAVVLEYLNDTIRTAEDVRKKLGLPCLGRIPRAKGRFLDELKSSIVSDFGSLWYAGVVASFQYRHGRPPVPACYQRTAGRRQILDCCSSGPELCPPRQTCSAD